jgi:CBS domain-containing protein
MTREVLLIGPDWPISDIARVMRDENVGAIPVAEDEELIGIVTDRDLVVRALADDATASRRYVARDVMSSDLVYCFEDQPVEEVLQGMTERQVRRLPVIDAARRLVGMVSLGDLSRSASASFALTAQRRMMRAALH